ncbi:alanine--tRNA ligase, cytoplasmic-like [Physella acuta]|uniref:alanine--tRNA ligase, cytoplasmic-like n=1 Tax=Physella acuta TaxID=109671 RepID=UPI0027DDB6A5|nr:alanine--tRNA ligase, cytoplasmic-like [Physella acuta]
MLTGLYCLTMHGLIFKIFKLQTHYFCVYRHASWSSHSVRATFVEYFKSRGHESVPSSTVIPKKGDGTYFTNSGMNQFKPIFLGECDPSSKFFSLSRAANSQKCIRVGGKHNDLDDVGQDMTHHTFFEMLGNWSFGDYFKEEACAMAYQLLTQEYKVPLNRLYFTYFSGDDAMNVPADTDCRNIWLSLGVPKERVLPFGPKENFWDMGVTGPCGPCTEIHYDHVGSRDAAHEVNTGSASVVEIWNLVFMQYNRLKDQSLKPLPKCHVDTGMGLERMTAVLNGTTDNYATDLFTPLLDYIQKTSGCTPYCSKQDDLNIGYRVLADHARMFTVAISDGLLPSHDNLGHKLRGIIHKCIHICRETFRIDPHAVLPSLVSLVVQSLGPVYPELRLNEKQICDILRATIQHHDRYREQALKSFNKMLAQSGGIKHITVEEMVALERGLYGSNISIEVISELAALNDLSLDLDGYDKFKQKVPQSSPSPLTSPVDSAATLLDQMVSLGVPTTDDGFKYKYISLGDGVYDFSVSGVCACHVLGLSTTAGVTDSLGEGENGAVILDRTCFYAEAGGQDSDVGQLLSETGTFEVSNVQNRRGYIVHYGHMTNGSFTTGQKVEPSIFQDTREGCMRNHTATHLLQAALAQVLPTTQQQGSSVMADKLTFDFLALTPFESSFVEQVETTVQKIIKQEYPVSRRVMSLDEALQLPGLKKLPNEEYPESVSVISIGPEGSSHVISVELCGGTHACNTSDLENFCITHVSTKSQNTKRITAVTGPEAEQAHVNGQVARSMAVVLANLLDKRVMSEMELKNLQKAINKADLCVDARLEKLEHGVAGPKPETKFIKALEDTKKVKDVVAGFLDTLDHLLNKTCDLEDSLKNLITGLKKCHQLELLPKYVRDEVHNCTEKLEYRVTDLRNKRSNRMLHQMIKNGTEVDQHVTTVHIDELDLTPRQISKSLSQQNWDQCIVLVKKSAKISNVFITLPLQKVQPPTQQEVNDLLAKLSQLGPAKVKLTSQSNKVAVYSCTVQGEGSDVSVVSDWAGQLLNK